MPVPPQVRRDRRQGQHRPRGHHRSRRSPSSSRCSIASTARVTAGNASPLTDGAAALLLMSEEKAKALGSSRSATCARYAYAATDPADQLLQGPAYAAPHRARPRGHDARDIDLVDMHEAFAAQVASQPPGVRVEGVRQEGWAAARRSARSTATRLNVNGGSIAVGHPFAATGARIVTQALRELKRRNKNTALCTVCAAGGLGAAVVLERA